MRYLITQLPRSVSWVLAFWLSVSRMLVIYLPQFIVPFYNFIFNSWHSTYSIVLTAQSLFVDLSIIATVLGLPQDLMYTPSNWNGMTHGNITVVIVLFLFRWLSILTLLTTLLHFAQGSMVYGHWQDTLLLRQTANGSPCRFKSTEWLWVY